MNRENWLNKCKAKRQKYVALLAKGWSLARIGKRYKVTPQAVSQGIKKETGEYNGSTKEK